MTAGPRYATRPTPGALNGSRAFRVIGRTLGAEMLPWQMQVNRVMSERHPDDPRRYRYPLVVITVPRQSGKTKGLACELCVRTLREPWHQAFFTAQTGKDARERHGDIVKSLDKSALAGYFDHVKRAGAESIVWPNGSEIRAFAPTASSLHGYTPPTVVVDEGWFFAQQDGLDLEGAVIPAQQTLPNRQFIIMSTMGDSRSWWFHDLVRRGREAVNDPDSTMAYFEWSMEPGTDPYDPRNWANFHPSFGHLVTEETLRDASQRVDPATWLRAFCNLPSRASTALIKAGAWADLADSAGAVGRPLAIGYEVSADRSQSIVVAAWMEDSRLRSRVVYADAGYEWLPGKVDEIAERLAPEYLIARDAEPTREITARIRSRSARGEMLNVRRVPNPGLDAEMGVYTMPTAEFVLASGNLIARAKAGTFSHDGDTRYLDAMDGAVMRPSGDGFALSARYSHGPIDALTATAAAGKIVDIPSRAIGKPQIRV